MGRSVLGNILKFRKNDPELSRLATLWKSRILELHRFDVLNISAYGGNSNTLVREWRRILIEGRLWSIATPKIWSGLLSALNENAILSPKELMMVPLQDLSRLIPPDLEGVDLDLLRRLWECSHTHNILSPFDVISTTPSDIQDCSNAFHLAKIIKGSSLEETPAVRSALASRAEMEKVVPGFSDVGPSQRIRRCMQAQLTPEEIACFQRSSVTHNVMKKVSLSLQSVSTALKVWGEFCDLNRIPHFPVDRCRVMEWSAYFNDSNTFSVYLSHLKTACILKGVSVDWDTPHLRAVARGLKRAGDHNRAVKSAISQDMLEGIIKVFGLEAEFSLFATIAWIFLLRAPSECLPLFRAEAWENLEEGVLPDHERQAIIGLRDGVVKISLRKRKNRPNGSVIFRACSCGDHVVHTAEDVQHVPRTLCPVHVLWPRIVAKCRAGDALFPSLDRFKINPTLRDLAKRLGWPRPDSYTSHGFRRGGARALVLADATYAQIQGAGQWASDAAKLYLDLGEIEMRTAARVAIADLSDSSSDDDLPLAERCHLSSRSVRRRL